MVRGCRAARHVKAEGQGSQYVLRRLTRGRHPLVTARSCIVGQHSTWLARRAGFSYRCLSTLALRVRGLPNFGELSNGRLVMRGLCAAVGSRKRASVRNVARMLQSEGQESD